MKVSSQLSLVMQLICLQLVLAVVSGLNCVCVCDISIIVTPEISAMFKQTVQSKNFIV